MYQIFICGRQIKRILYVSDVICERGEKFCAVNGQSQLTVTPAPSSGSDCTETTPPPLFHFYNSYLIMENNYIIMGSKIIPELQYSF